jgi:hypothetical protein
MKKNVYLILVLVGVIAAGAGFFAGMKYQQSRRPNFSRQLDGQRPTGQQGTGLGNNQMRFRPVNGEIISNDDKSITVKLQDGSSKIVLISDETAINQAVETTKDDLKTGETVVVMGQENSDGSITALNIQVGERMDWSIGR